MFDLTLFRLGGSDDPNFCRLIYSNWVEISILFQSQLPTLPRSGRFMVGDEKETTNQNIHRNTGFWEWLKKGNFSSWGWLGGSGKL